MQLLQPTNISVSSQLLQVEAFELSLPDEGRVRGLVQTIACSGECES